MLLYRRYSGLLLYLNDIGKLLYLCCAVQLYNKPNIMYMNLLKIKLHNSVIINCNTKLQNTVNP